MDYETLTNQLHCDFEKSDIIDFDFERGEWFISPPLHRYFDELLGFPEDPYVMKDFLSCMIADLKMMLLADSLIYFNSFYAKKRNWEVSSFFQTDFYYDEETFIEELEKFIDTFKINGGNIRTGILNSPNGKVFKKVLPRRMPRLAFTWFGFSLCRHYTEFNY